ncbi:MAG: NAD(P)-binding protein, partial [Candidatus Binatus sp.]
MPEQKPIRVAVIGGGCAAISAAFELSRPAHNGKYQVTIYQLGWRLGGKGASGRGPAALTTSPVIGMPVLTNEVPEQSTQMSAIPKRRRRGRNVLIVTLSGVLVAFCGLTARLFVFPASGMPAHVDAIVMLNGRGAPERFQTALDLARARRAGVLLLSTWHSFGGNGPSGTGFSCGPPIPQVKVLCFNPNPDTTQGEVEFAARMAKRYHWHSIALV